MNSLTLTSFLLGKHYLGVEHFTVDNEEMIALLLIEHKKEGLVVLQKDRVEFVDKIADKWNPKLPYFVVVNTNQVLQKEVDSIDVSDEKLVYKAFPNTNFEEFYFEIWRLKTKSIIAIARKTYIEEIIGYYKQQSIAIAGISLGVTGLSEIIDYVKEDSLFTNTQSVSKSEEFQLISSNVPVDSINYNINELDIQNRHLLAFSGVLRLITDSSVNSGSILSCSEPLYSSYLQNQFFTKGIKIFIGVLLSILLLNFVFFTHYYKLAEETNESVLVNKSSLEDVTTLKQRINVKEEKVKNSVIQSDSQSSFLINEIVKNIPSSILLSELTFNPLEKKIKTDEVILISNKNITIVGTTLSNDDFTHWIENIEKQKLINTVLITHFGKNDVNETEFSIKITLK